MQNWNGGCKAPYIVEEGAHENGEEGGIMGKTVG